MSEWPAFIDLQDLAPGERIAHPRLPRDVAVHPVASAADPLFEVACELLEKEFAQAGEMEERAVLAERLRWHTQPPAADTWMRYELLLLSVGGEWAGVRDHTIIVSQGEVTVHLSHVLVLPRWRQCGLAALLRTLPATGARRAAAQAGMAGAAITLLCEMELARPGEPAHRIRRRSYEKAGFRAIPPGHGYMQPDFRQPDKIAADPLGASPVPFDLLLRRIGREAQTTVAGSEVSAHVRRVYAMYETSFGTRHMEPCNRWFKQFSQNCPETFSLILPTLFL